MKKITAILTVLFMITAFTACDSKNSVDESSIQPSETSAVTETKSPVETTIVTEEIELVEPDYPVFTPDVNAITFNDSDDLYTAHCMNEKNFENDEAECELSVAEYKGERQLKIEVKGYNEKTKMYKTPKIVFDMDELVGSDNLSKVKSFSADITQVAVGEFIGDDGEAIIVPGNLMGTFGSNVGEDCSDWYEPTGSSNAYAQEEWNFEWEYLHVEGKWLLKGFTDGTTDSTLVFMRWSIPNQADVYIDNLTFYDEDGNTIPIIYTPSEESSETENSLGEDSTGIN